MASAAGLWLVLTLVSTVAYSGVAVLVEGAGAGALGVIRAHALLGIGLTLLRTVGWALMLIGVVQLAVRCEPRTALTL